MKFNTEKERSDYIENNLGLVYSIADKLCKTSRVDSKEDLIQDGIVGLIVAVDTFDDNRGVKFSTYAYTIIYHEMITSLKKQKNDSSLDALIERIFNDEVPDIGEEPPTSETFFLDSFLAPGLITDTQREIIIRRIFKKEDFHKIAKELKLGYRNCMYQFHFACNRIRKYNTED